jgi:DMSO/TMAO reductase YedYZ molybdopterin-dependent catalytic subunit
MNDAPTQNTHIREHLDHAGQAGFLAALVMIAAQLVWRLNWSQDGVVQALPEFIVAAIARLTPLSIFGAATENYGSLAKKTLFFSVLLGIAAVGFQGGNIAGRLTRRTGQHFFGRLAASGIVAGVLLLVTLVVIMPIAYLGIFARDSSYASQILVQLFVTFGIFALVWAVLMTPASDVEQLEGVETMSRRTLLSDTAFNGATVASLIAVVGSGWRLVTPRSEPVDAATTRQAVDDIVATQRAQQGLALPSPTPISQASAEEVASLTSDFVIQDDIEIIELFAELDADEKITPVLTAVPDFYNVSKNISDPTVNADGWTLKVTGMVDREIELTYGDLVERATTQKITTLSCISNELNGDLTGTALWTGLPLAELLNEAGVQEGAVDLKFHAADDYEDSVSVEIGLRPDNLIVVGMNGETLTDKHGYPARLIIPDIYGMKNVKWLDRIEVVDENFLGYWQTRGWSDLAVAQIWGRIDYPEHRQKLEPGPQTLTGVASAGARDISRVEISLDDGESWADALLEPSLSPPFSWVRWAITIDAQPGEYKMRLRATDGTGEVMIEQERSPLPNGATGWPRRRFEVGEA